MTLAGGAFAPPNKVSAERAGVRLVMQELNLLGNLTVAENIFFDQMPNRMGWIDYRQLNAAARKVMDELGLREVPATRMVHSLGVGQQQLVEIAAGLSRRCRVLILDEPTAHLDVEQERLLRESTRRLCAGRTVLVIAHRLPTVVHASQIIVMKEGRVVESGTHLALQARGGAYARLLAAYQGGAQ